MAVAENAVVGELRRLLPRDRVCRDKRALSVRLARDEAGAEERVIDAGAEIMHVRAAAGGSLTGEHGIGMEKQDLMPPLFSREDVGQRWKIKEAFDPRGVSNPDTMFPTAGRCLELFARRGRAAGW